MDTQENQGAGKPAESLPAAQSDSQTAKLNLAAYRRARRKNAQQEAYWAGRNRAGRRSTRAAA
jgi:hypothetical protein